MKGRAQTIGGRRQRNTNTAAFIFLLPAAIFMFVFIFYPIVDSFIISTYKWNGIAADKQFIGLANWAKLVRDGNFWFAFRNNIIIMVMSIVIQIPIGLAEATFIEFCGKKGTAFKVLWFIPMLMSSVAIGFLFTYALAANGGHYQLGVPSFRRGKYRSAGQSENSSYDGYYGHCLAVCPLLHGLLHGGVHQYIPGCL